MSLGAYGVVLVVLSHAGEEPHRTHANPQGRCTVGALSAPQIQSLPAALAFLLIYKTLLDTSPVTYLCLRPAGPPFPWLQVQVVLEAFWRGIKQNLGGLPCSHGAVGLRRSKELLFQSHTDVDTSWAQSSPFCVSLSQWHGLSEPVPGSLPSPF